MKTAWGWSAKLTRSIVLKDGTRLATLGDVRAFILKQPEHIQERGSWQHAAELMILAAERGGSIEAATTQIEDAMFLEARYVRQGTDGPRPAPKWPGSTRADHFRRGPFLAAARDRAPRLAGFMADRRWNNRDTGLGHRGRDRCPCRKLTL
jgi:hypothetical protein